MMLWLSRRCLLLGLLGVLLTASNGWCEELEAGTVSPEALYNEVWGLIAGKFVDEDKNGQDWRIWQNRYAGLLKTPEDGYVAVETMLASLEDRYTRFLEPEAFKEETDSIQATLFGIGIQIGVKDNKLLVISPIEDTPAFKAGLKANDEILSINAKSTLGMSIKQGADLIRGKKGTPVVIVVKREGKELAFTVLRDEIKLKSVSVQPPLKASVVPESLGYIRLSSFLSKSASEEFEKALKDQADKAGYIVDLRGNPGGLLTNAISIADMFLRSGAIVSTVDRNGYKQVAEASPALVTDKPLVILIDEGSASASEILSGALKDHGRALLVGRTTFGKGLVQEINPLSSKAGLNITIQKYLTPNDTDINKKGIAPDVMVKPTEADLKAEKDTPLAKAVDVLLAKISAKPIK
jgi:carboxyl-terminal processing protease